MLNKVAFSWSNVAVEESRETEVGIEPRLERLLRYLNFLKIDPLNTTLSSSFHRLILLLSSLFVKDSLSSLIWNGCME